MTDKELDYTNVVVYLLVAISFFFNRFKDFSCSTQRLFVNNIVVRHVFNLVSVFFMIVLLTRTTPVNPRFIILFTLGVYGIFILLTRCDIRFIVVYFIVATIIFYIEIEKSYLKVKHPDREEGLYKTHMIKLSQIQIILEILSIVLIIIGCLIYIGQKSKIHGNKNWKWSTFFLGTVKCSNLPKKINSNIGSDLLEGLRRVVNCSNT